MGGTPARSRQDGGARARQTATSTSVALQHAKTLSLSLSPSPLHSTPLEWFLLILPPVLTASQKDFPVGIMQTQTQFVFEIMGK